VDRLYICLVRSSIRSCIPDCHSHSITSTKCRINTVVSPDSRPKHVQIDKYTKNKNTKNKLCTELALFTKIYRDTRSTTHKIKDITLKVSQKMRSKHYVMVFVCVCVCFVCVCVCVKNISRVSRKQQREAHNNETACYTEPACSEKVKVKCSRDRPGVAQRVRRGIALLFHDGGTRRGWEVNSTPGLHLPPGKTRYPLYRRLGGPQGRSGRSENLVPTGIRPRTLQPVVNRYTDWATGPTWIVHTNLLIQNMTALLTPNCHCYKRIWQRFTHLRMPFGICSSICSYFETL
jgi:hypothetical protein